MGQRQGAVEEVGLSTMVNADFWRGRRVFITGHTGFKGGWLSLWLQSLGAELQGYALDAPTAPSLFAEARVAQVRHAKAGETVSYGATETLARDTIIAVAAVGYADGYHRAASGSGVRLREMQGPAGHGFVQGQRVPILGRVTMDLTMFDVTDLGEGMVNRGDMIELFGPNISVDEAAEAAGTISYELLTGLGRRYHRRYVESGS